MLRKALLVFLFLLLAPVKADQWYGLDKFSDYGFVTAMEGNTLVVGNPLAPWTDGTKTLPEAGSVKIYTRDEMGAWKLTTTIFSNTPTAYAGFGWSVAINGKRIVIGEPLSSSAAPRVHILERNVSGEWKRVKRLVVPRTEYMAFGFAVAVEGTFVVASAVRGDQGFVLIYQFTKDGWMRKSILSTPDTTIRGQFGYSLALKNQLLLVGQSDGAGSVYPGAAFLYKRISGVWSKTGELRPSHDDYQTGYGTSVDLDGNSIIIGAPRSLRVTPDRNLVGAAYIYRNSNNVWTEQGLILPSDPQYPYNNFASLVAVEGNTAVISTYDLPLVHVFENTAGNGWVEKPLLLQSYQYSTMTRALPNGRGCGVDISNGIIATCSGNLQNPYAPRRLHTFRSSQLVLNGDFENYIPSKNAPRVWTMDGASTGGVICNSPEATYAHKGNCAYNITASSSLLIQLVPPHGIKVGDRLVLRVAIKQTVPEDPATNLLEVQIPRSGGGVKRLKVNLSNAPTGQYVELVRRYTVDVLPSGPITVRLNYSGVNGDILVDDVRLTLVRSTTQARSWIALPVAP